MRRTIHVYLGQGARLVGTLRFEAQGARQSAGFDAEAKSHLGL